MGLGGEPTVVEGIQLAIMLSTAGSLTVIVASAQLGCPMRSLFGASWGLLDTADTEHQATASARMPPDLRLQQEVSGHPDRQRVISAEESPVLILAAPGAAMQRLHMAACKITDVLAWSKCVPDHN